MRKATCGKCLPFCLEAVFWNAGGGYVRFKGIHVEEERFRGKFRVVSSA